MEKVGYKTGVTSGIITGFKEVDGVRVEARARLILGVGDEEAWEIAVHYHNKSYIVGSGESILGGMEIFVLIPNPPRDKVHEWVVEVRKCIPEDIPIIFEFTEKGI